MLRDADRSLANWLGELLPPGAGLRFEAPDPRWARQLPEPAFVSVFLLGVTRDERARPSGWSDVRGADGQVVGRQVDAQYFRLAYLVTAWAGPLDGDGAAARVMAEHELLGAVLSACALHGVLPEHCLDGMLADGGEAVVECAPAHAPMAAGPLWSGLGIAPRAYLELVLVAPVRPPVLTDLAPSAREIVLSAAQERPGGRSVDESGPALGTVRRWQRQTVSEVSSPAPSRSS